MRTDGSFQSSSASSAHAEADRVEAPEALAVRPSPVRASSSHLPLQSFQGQRLPTGSRSPLSLHEAIVRHDVSGVRGLLRDGRRLATLDEERLSPLDLLDSIGAPQPIAKALRQALLSSSNPSAPPGHMKPEALHGSPWGIEILTAQSLERGLHAPKGGHSSLEGMVFFSTRSPDSVQSTTTRADLRTGPRRYARGGASSTNSPQQAGIRYQLTNDLLARLEQGQPVRTAGREDTITADSREAVLAQLGKQIGFAFSLSAQRIPAGNTELRQQALEGLPFYGTIVQQTSQGGQYRFTGEALQDLYRDAVSVLKQQQEASGNVPLLCLLNRGQIVPVVFGFNKISGLETHTLRSGKQHAYQAQGHPLSGSEQGGKLTEIEVGSIDDLATLSLACLKQGTAIPANTVIRINPTAQEKRATGERAAYMTPQQWGEFQRKLKLTISAQQGVAPDDIDAMLGTASLVQLQHINADIRKRAKEGAMT